MSEQLLIVSLKYSPGLKQLFESLGRAIETETDYSVDYLVSEAYKQIGGIDGDARYVNTSDSISGVALDTLNPVLVQQILEVCSQYGQVILYNPHLLNLFIAVGTDADTSVSFYLHEPYTPNKSCYGIASATNITMLEYFQKATVRFADTAILPSALAMERYESYYSTGTQTELSRFVMADSTVEHPASSPPEHFTMIGMVNEATGHDHFTQLLKQEREYNYCLITPTDLDFLSDSALTNVKTVNNIERCFDRQTVDSLLSSSYAVFKLNQELTQSSVVPDAFKNATPVIGRDIPALTRQIEHKETGYIVPYDFDTNDLLEAMEYVKSHAERLSRNALQVFDDTYSLRQFETHYSWITDEQ